MCWGSNSNGQIGDGTNTNRSSATSVPSFTANMSALVRLTPSQHGADVTALLNCRAGAQYRVEISITQGAVGGRGNADGRCTGGLERVPVRIRTYARALLVTGEAQATAVFDVRRRGRALDHQEWARKVTIERE